MSINPPLLSNAPGVNRHHRAGDIASPLTHEKRRHRCDVLRLSQAAQWTSPNYALALRSFETTRHVGVYKSGRDRVHVYADCSDLTGQRLRESDERRLSGGINGKAIEAG